ncbi:RepB family plasmid replication initiator protein [Spirosoma telluris]|uniref:RepB family plasmid replication initiator protein n=1 Tax=Spirosoma telluris TaxID=2183553 RepID=UPI0012FB1CB3
MDIQNEQLQIAFEPRKNNYQPNLITESKQEFTEMEKKIVVLAINQLRHVALTWQRGQNVTLLIPYAELTDNHHSKISAAASTLNTKRIVYQDFSNPKNTNSTTSFLFHVFGTQNSRGSDISSS